MGRLIGSVIVLVLGLYVIRLGAVVDMPAWVDVLSAVVGLTICHAGFNLRTQPKDQTNDQ
ncbi:hypothetical protein JL11_07890 [Brevundimonas sp. DS20]|nr:hypothetical protein JL11_07890 [Brevundimonas sp. DS20]